MQNGEIDVMDYLMKLNEFITQFDELLINYFCITKTKCYDTKEGFPVI
jgi:hypothetical protein